MEESDELKEKKKGILSALLDSLADTEKRIEEENKALEQEIARQKAEKTAIKFMNSQTKVNLKKEKDQKLIEVKNRKKIEKDALDILNIKKEKLIRKRQKLQKTNSKMEREILNLFTQDNQSKQHPSITRFLEDTMNLSQFEKEKQAYLASNSATLEQKKLYFLINFYRNLSTNDKAKRERLKRLGVNDVKVEKSGLKSKHLPKLIQHKLGIDHVDVKIKTEFEEPAESFYHFEEGCGTVSETTDSSTAEIEGIKTDVKPPFEDMQVKEEILEEEFLETATSNKKNVLPLSDQHSTLIRNTNSNLSEINYYPFSKPLLDDMLTYADFSFLDKAYPKVKNPNRKPCPPRPKTIKPNSNKLCKVCGIALNKKTSLSHMVDAHSLAECPFCEIEDFPSLKEHVFVDHFQSPIFRCQMCPFTTTSSKTLARHKITHRDRNLYCGLCRKWFNDETQLSLHLAMYPDGSCKVTKVPKTTDSKSTDVDFDAQRFEGTCDICGASFACSRLALLKSCLRRHRLSVHFPDKGFKCDECGKIFTSVDKIKKHKIHHTDVRSFVCTFPSCGKRFKTLHNLNQHKKFHEPPKFFCVCGSKFFFRFALNKHRKTCNLPSVVENIDCESA